MEDSSEDDGPRELGRGLIYIHEGRSNPHGIQLELMTADRLDIDKNEVLQNGNIIRMGIEMEQRTRRPKAYWINVSENPLYESYAFNSAVGGTYERIPDERIVHVGWVVFQPGVGRAQGNVCEHTEELSPDTLDSHKGANLQVLHRG